MTIRFPQHLPICQRLEEIQALLQAHQVVIVAGETGSGKTTQLPKLALQMGLAEHGMIAHTQPRRLAARSVAQRIAEELNTSLGENVGYQVRFKDVSSADTKIKLMTDGVLLQELQHDRMLKKYQTIIIDEAHERSLNIDFLLGLLKPLCRKRPELKLIITSATIDLEKFANHFATNGTPAPVIEVSGRTFPVEVVYQEPEHLDPNIELAEQIAETVRRIIRDEAKGYTNTSGDILVFCAGEREIRQASDAIAAARLPVDILPLFARLSVPEQNKIFQPSQQRKVVLATNVAETSLTVPGIAYVIDPGLARISRYSFRSKVQRLPIERISQASANQRKGRCGRVANGVCFRLYSESDFLQRAEFTPAEILRSNLAAVILRMLRLGITDVFGFDYLDTPDRRLLNDGFKLLQELNAIDENHSLTQIGRQMSELSLDPKYARILVEAKELACLRDAIVLLSVLSIQDPRERPAENKAKAEQYHAQLSHPRSDFMSFLQLWQLINRYKRDLSNSQFRKLCLQQYWSIARYFEWRELVGQISRQCKALGWRLENWRDLDLPIMLKETGTDLSSCPVNPAFSGAKTARYQALHQALISGLLGQFSFKTRDGSYQGARGKELHIFPASVLAKRKPNWLISAEWIETSRLFAHNNGLIEPEWLIKPGRHLCRYQFTDPYYHKKSGTIKANRQTLLYGIVIKGRESVSYAKFDPIESRRLFIQRALLEGQYQPRKNAANVLLQNRALIRDVEKLETKTRRRNLLADDRQLFDFYDQRLPKRVNNRSSFEGWLRKEPSAIKLRVEDVLLTSPDENLESQFPDHIEVKNKRLKLSYTFSPGQAGDGVSLELPLALLPHFPIERGDWLVPGLIAEKCTALLKTLPKSIRKQFAPAIQSIERVLPKLPFAKGNLQTNLAQALFRDRGIKIEESDFQPHLLEDYYRLNYYVLDEHGQKIDESRDLLALQEKHKRNQQQSIAEKQAPEQRAFEKLNMQSWEFDDDLPSVFHYTHEGMQITAYPMLKENESNDFDLLLDTDPNLAAFHTHSAIISLAMREMQNSQQAKYLSKELLQQEMSSSGLSSLKRQLSNIDLDQQERQYWKQEVMRACLQVACFADGTEAIRNKDVFQAALQQGQKDWVARSIELAEIWRPLLATRNQLLSRLNTITARSIAEDTVLEDIKLQLYRLFEPEVLRYRDITILRHYSRYLKAIDVRLQNLKTDQDVVKHASQFSNAIAKIDPDRQQLFKGIFLVPELGDYALLIEELRVSLFAQSLGTQKSVSDLRLSKFWSSKIEPKLDL